jgi:N-acyl-D-aspartate/D-glutamate deacylase
MMFDLLIKRARIIDGTGAPGWVGDVAVQNGKFVAVDPQIAGEARQIIEAGGLVLAPGFIDMHGHSDIYLLEHPEGDIKVRQGVTLDVVGNCGMSLAPVEPGSREAVQGFFSQLMCKNIAPFEWLSFGEYATATEKQGLSMHVAGLVGHGSIRTAAMGFSDAAPAPGQMAHMKHLLAQAMEDGAYGLSTGLILLPGCYAKSEELIELSHLVGRKGGIYVTHVRNEAQGILASVAETLRIGREANLPVHISHMKVSGMKNWPLAEQLIQMMKSARGEGLDVTCDLYPYTVMNLPMLAVLPPWSVEGGMDALISRVGNKGERNRIIRDIKEGLPGWENFYHNAGWDKIAVASVKSEERKFMEGKSIEALAQDAHQDPFDFALDLLASERGAVNMFPETISEKNVILFLSLPFSMIGSDGVPAEGKNHPRLYGTFPRVIRRYVRELKVLELEEAVKKMSWLPAQRLGIRNGGAIKKGFRADAVLFNFETFADKSTFENPRQFPEGLAAVIVNGRIVIDGPKHTGSAPGVFMRAGGG